MAFLLAILKKGYYVRVSYNKKRRNIFIMRRCLEVLNCENPSPGVFLSHWKSRIFSTLYFTNNFLKIVILILHF